MKIYEGVIDRTGNARINSGSNVYEFIEIGGERINKVEVDDYLDSFICVGDNVALSCFKGWGSPHQVYAVREQNGRINKSHVFPLIVLSVVLFGCTLILTALPMIFVIGIMQSWLPVILWLPGSAWLVFLGMRGHFKARHSLDSFEQKNSPAAETAS